MHWCADETQAVINVLSTVDVAWIWLRSLLARLLRHRLRGPARAACDCGHDHEGSTG